MKLSTAIEKALKNKKIRIRRKPEFDNPHFIYSPTCGCLVGAACLVANKKKALKWIKRYGNPARWGIFKGVSSALIDEVDERFEGNWYDDDSDTYGKKESAKSILKDLKSRGL